MLGIAFLVLSTVLSFNSAEMITEAMAAANALRFDPNDPSLIQSAAEDVSIKDSPFFIKHKLELYVLCSTHTNRAITVISMGVLVLFLTGSMLVKCVSSCVSLTQGMSYALYGDLFSIQERWPFDPYYFSVFIFAVIATCFGLGNIENSRPLQVAVMCLRLLLVALMICIPVYVLFTFGHTNLAQVKLVDFGHVRYLIANALLVTFLHHSVPGLVYPMRPQVLLQSSFIASYASQLIIVVLHFTVAVLAFGDRTNDCHEFPCAINVATDPITSWRRRSTT